MGNPVLPAEEFDNVYAAMVQSPTWDKILSDALGDEYLAGFDAFSYLPLTTLKKVARELKVGPGQRFVDLASGLRGLGQWTLQQTGASLVGVDFSAFSCGHAERRAKERGLADRTRYVVGDVADTGLETEGFDAAMSLGVMLFVPDPMKALRDAARIIKKGSRFILVTYDHSIEMWAKLPDDGYRSLLPQAGFEVLSYEDVPDWYATHKKIHGGILKNREALVREMGKTQGEHLINEAESAPLDCMNLFISVCVKK